MQVCLLARLVTQPERETQSAAVTCCYMTEGDPCRMQHLAAAVGCVIQVVAHSWGLVCLFLATILPSAACWLADDADSIYLLLLSVSNDETISTKISEAN